MNIIHTQPRLLTSDCVSARNWNLRLPHHASPRFWPARSTAMILAGLLCWGIGWANTGSAQPPPAPPATPAEQSAGAVTSVKGQATLTRSAVGGTMPVRFKDPVFQGDQISTGEDALVRLLLGGKALVTIRELSTFTVRETTQRAELDLKSGKVAVNVARSRMAPGEELHIRTPNVVASVRGTVFVVEVTPAQEGSLGALTEATSTVSVISGEVEVGCPGGSCTPSTVVSLQQLKVTGAKAGPVSPLSPQAAGQLVDTFKSQLSLEKGSAQGRGHAPQGEMAKAVNLAKQLFPQTLAGEKQQGESSSGQTSQSSQGNQTGTTSSTPSEPGGTPPSGSGDALSPTSPTPSGPRLGGGGGLSAPTVLSPLVVATSQLTNTLVEIGNTSLAQLTSATIYQGDNKTITSFNQSGGELTGPGVLTVTGSMVWTGGQETGTGTTLAAGTLDIGGSATKLLSRTLAIAGTSSLSGTGDLVVPGGTLAILPGGSLTLTSGAPVLGTGIIANAGTLSKTDTTTTTIVPTVVNTGTISIQAGAVTLSGDSLSSGPIAISPNRTLEFSNNTHLISGDVSGNGNLLVSGGTVVVSGGTYSTGRTGVTGGSLLFSSGATLSSLGNLTVTGGTLALNSGETLSLDTVNLGGGIVTGSDTLTLNTSGTLTKSGPGTSTLSLPISSGGTIQVNGGILLLTGGGTYSGSMIIAGGTTLEFGGGTHTVTLNTGSEISGDGTLLLSSGTLIGTGTGQYRLTGTFAISGGSFSNNKILSASTINPLTPLGTIFALSGGTVDVAQAVVEAVGDNAMITTTQTPLITVTGNGTYNLASSIGPSFSMVVLKGTTTTTDTLTGLVVGTERPLQHQGPLLHATNTTVSAHQILTIDTALLEASAPLIDIINSTLTVSGPGISLLNNASLTTTAGYTGTLLALNAATLALTNNSLLESVTQNLVRIGGDFLTLTNGSRLTFSSLSSGLLIKAGGGSVIDINGAVINFGGTGGNQITVNNTLVPDYIDTNFPQLTVRLTNGASPSNITIQGNAIKNTSLGTISRPNGGSLFQLDGPNTKLIIRGN